MEGPTQHMPPPPSTPPPGYGSTGMMWQGARMPIPGNAEWLLWFVVEIVFAIIWAASPIRERNDLHGDDGNRHVRLSDLARDREGVARARAVRLACRSWASAVLTAALAQSPVAQTTDSELDRRLVGGSLDHVLNGCGRDGILAAALGLIEGCVGRGHERVGVCIGREFRDTEAHRHARVLAVGAQDLDLLRRPFAFAPPSGVRSRASNRAARLQTPRRRTGRRDRARARIRRALAQRRGGFRRPSDGRRCR